MYANVKEINNNNNNNNNNTIGYCNPNVSQMYMRVFTCVTRGGSRDLERGGALCWQPWLADEENFRFQMV